MSDQKKTINPRAQSLIDDSLKLVYADMQDEALPDRFVELLSKLKEQDGQSDQSGDK